MRTPDHVAWERHSYSLAQGLSGAGIQACMLTGASLSAAAAVFNLSKGIPWMRGTWAMCIRTMIEHRAWNQRRVVSVRPYHKISSNSLLYYYYIELFDNDIRYDIHMQKCKIRFSK